jgi:hypothetical protein
LKKGGRQTWLSSAFLFRVRLLAILAFGAEVLASSEQTYIQIPFDLQIVAVVRI